MKILRESIEVHSTGMRPSFFTITKQVEDFLARTGVQEGLCVVYTHHTTCSVMTQECSFDETYTGLEYLQQDLVDVFEAIIPTCRKEGQYMHPGPKLTEFSALHNETKPETLNTDAHLRSVFIGRNECIIIKEGKLDLGAFGHIYFIDFDQTRPRDRTIEVQIIGE
ncbi:secondary thiamine-phosphate synthase enzyme YjbQ [Eubacteriales bacterium OttesenSCG-928-K08]|nr:secondary thiamine-phosphate synthase enzyme YjbQ [Eubacteriales bacterium OttesenSCG-928-K08]